MSTKQDDVKTESQQAAKTTETKNENQQDVVSDVLGDDVVVTGSGASVKSTAELDKPKKATRKAKKTVEPVAKVESVAESVVEAEPVKNPLLLKIRNNTPSRRFEIASRTWLEPLAVTEVHCVSELKKHTVHSNIRQMAGKFNFFEVVE